MVVPVLILQWYLLAWLCWPTMARVVRPHAPRPMVRMVDSCFDPVWDYCEQRYPGGTFLYRLWWTVNGTLPFDESKIDRPWFG